MKRRIKIGIVAFLSLFLGTIVILFFVTLIRAMTLEDIDYHIEEFLQDVTNDIPDEYLAPLPQKFGHALQFKTVSRNAGDYDTEQLLLFHEFLKESFPLTFNSSVVKVEVINTYSILLTVEGSNLTLLPYMLTAHMDVVPVDPDQWSHDPFLGEVVPDPVTGEDVIWGRGAIDNKLGLMGILFALEYLLSVDWQPNRSFFIGFGHDEEVGGEDGAQHIAKTLQERSVKLEFLLDEGLVVLDGVMKGIDKPVAAIGVTEKGYMDVRLEVEGPGGHSSIPPHDQAVSRLSTALHNIYSYPQPSMFGKGPEWDMLKYIAPQAYWPYKLIYANLWLFGPLVEVTLSQQRETNAIIRTTTAVTIVRAGVKNNIIPTTASALINHRVHPAQSLDDVIRHDTEVIGDPHIKLIIPRKKDPPHVSPYGPNVVVFRLLAAAVKRVFPDAVTIPGLMIANTDTCHYLALTAHVYRFIPTRLNRSLLSTIHGHDERIPTAELQAAVNFYFMIITLADELEGTVKYKTGHQSGEL